MTQSLPSTPSENSEGEILAWLSYLIGENSDLSDAASYDVAEEILAYLRSQGLINNG
jgi:hypothetical protein